MIPFFAMQRLMRRANELRLYRIFYTLRGSDFVLEKEVQAESLYAAARAFDTTEVDAQRVGPPHPVHP